MFSRMALRVVSPRTALTLMILLTLGPASATAQAAREPALDLSTLEWTLPIGEIMHYGLDVAGRFKVGEGTLAIEDVDIVDGLPAYRVSMTVQVGTLFYKVRDRRVSWIGEAPLRSLRFEQSIKEGKRQRRHRTLLDPSGRTYRDEVWDEQAGAYRLSEEGATPATAAGQVFDELAFLYVLRLLPVDRGRYSLDGYFRTEENPIRLRVVGREKIRVPAGRFKTIVLAPVIPGDNLLDPGREVRVYLSDDERRLIVMMTSQTGVGEARLYLQRYDEGKTRVAMETN